MRSCFTKKDMEGLYRAAHNLKGVSANLGALQLYEYARRLEKQVGQSYTDGIESMINDIMTTSDKLKENATIFLLSRN
jgi:HPt (histidine-containing phosphotransfer) domain-containing protein